MPTVIHDPEPFAVITSRPPPEGSRKAAITDDDGLWHGYELADGALVREVLVTPSAAHLAVLVAAQAAADAREAAIAAGRIGPGMRAKVITAAQGGTPLTARETAQVLLAIVRNLNG